MNTIRIDTELPGVFILEPKVFHDKRGYFMEVYHETRYNEIGILPRFVQDNHSRSQKNILRGLHYQLEHAQDKLISVIRGAIFDVAVDIRRGSPTFGKWIGVELSCSNNRQLFVPKGFAHGFCVLSDNVDVLYKCSDYYSPQDEGGVLWNDPDIGIRWPVDDPVLSPKDLAYSRLKDIPAERLPS
ncbi:MAG: dTDP-4-dehydrorhamnose 3,5-epimerase [Candidatus Auribacterota bacterium]|jgi:dTDP-4-dehydrorhamnose 3,5-epimerase|nr:dTDP-4-dehydrorhamnose 3,5-epimerase [Candidatus Auribacterota bacterium]